MGALGDRILVVIRDTPGRVRRAKLLLALVFQHRNQLKVNPSLRSPLPDAHFCSMVYPRLVGRSPVDLKITLLSDNV